MTLYDTVRHGPARKPSQHGNARHTRHVPIKTSGKHMTGVVKWYKPGLGFGFLSPDDGSRDVHVHITAVQHAGFKTLNEGERIEFDVVPGQKGKDTAVNLRRV